MAKENVIVHRDELHAELSRFIADVLAGLPDVREGEVHVFNLEGGYVGCDDEDRSVVDFVLKTQRVRDLGSRRTRAPVGAAEFDGSELHAALDAYVDYCVAELPNVEDGCVNVFEVELGVVAEHKGVPLIGGGTTTSTRRML